MGGGKGSELVGDAEMGSWVVRGLRCNCEAVSSWASGLHPEMGFVVASKQGSHKNGNKTGEVEFIIEVCVCVCE